MKSCLFSIYRVNPLGIAESKYLGKKRLIVDLSAPHNDDNHSSYVDMGVDILFY